MKPSRGTCRPVVARRASRPVSAWIRSRRGSQGVFWQEDLAVMVLPLQQMLHLVTLLLLLRRLCSSRELTRELTREPSPHHK